ncbi:SpoVR family protein, partial [Mesomycoplasma ovipneumoniae]|uniref:SpoVR family protein n=1 Tax=Mesomycoplasma ovipneumoniae TaxID=29562 RepID=UPI003080FDD1
IKLAAEDMYMNDWINPKEWVDKENNKIVNKAIAEDIGVMIDPNKDVLKYLYENSPLVPWQRDILSIVYKEAAYFSPQGITKVANEGWASFVDAQIMARFGYAGPEGIFEYAEHKAGVLGGDFSTNPYKLGYSFFLEIEERYNKGRFGFEYD